MFFKLQIKIIRHCLRPIESETLGEETSSLTIPPGNSDAAKVWESLYYITPIIFSFFLPCAYRKKSGKTYLFTHPY